MTAVPKRTDFEAVYAGQAPWDIGKPQQPFIDRADQISGSVLDAGCGTGDTALLFAGRGCQVTGIDFIEEAINRARRKAAERGVQATFLVKDALTLAGCSERFDNVIDSGLFHVFSDEDRRRYVEGLATVLKPGGRLFLLCLSDEEPGRQRLRCRDGSGTEIAIAGSKESGHGAAWPWRHHGPWSPLAAACARHRMSTFGYACCSECGRKLHTTFFCSECGQPSCSLDCYCRHEARHAEEQQGAPPELPAAGSSTRLEPAR